MATQFEFDKTSIPGQYTINLRDNYQYSWIDTRTSDLYRVMFTSIAKTIKLYARNGMKRVGMAMKDDKGRFKFGAILNFRQPDGESEEDTGNWYLEFTLNEGDMVDLEDEIDNHSDAFISTVQHVAYELSFGRYNEPEHIYTTFNEAIDTLVAFLDQNANETEEIGVELRGIFTASVAIENGEKIMSIVPGEIIKQAVKNDAAL